VKWTLKLGHKIYGRDTIKGLTTQARNFVVVLVCIRKNMTEQRGSVRNVAGCYAALARVVDGYNKKYC
jgi:hypothetical protein